MSSGVAVVDPKKQHHSLTRFQTMTSNDDGNEQQLQTVATTTRTTMTLSGTRQDCDEQFDGIMSRGGMELFKSHT